MKTKDRVKIYIQPSYLEMKSTTNGFKLSFYGFTNKGKGKEHLIEFDCDLWWIRFMCRDFQKMIDEHKAEIYRCGEFLKPNNPNING